MPETGVALRVRGLRKSFGATPVLRDVSVEVAAGGCVAVLGPSGSGKSTLLRVVAGLAPADEGSVEIHGVVTDDPEPRVPPEARGVAFLFQDLALWPHMSLRGNLDFVLEARGVPRSERRAAGDRAAASARLPSALLDRRPADVSGGERQRAAIARALAQAPRLVLLDEPLSHLDPGLRARLLLELRHLREQAGLSTLLVTHDIEEAFALAQSVVVMQAGRVVQAGPPLTVYERPASRFVAEFVGRASFLPAVRRDGRLATSVGEFPADRAPEGPLLAVVRPERIRPVPGGPVRARVEDAVFLGDHWLWETSVGAAGAECRVLVRADRPAERGEIVSLAADPPAFVPDETPSERNPEEARMPEPTR